MQPTCCMSGESVTKRIVPSHVAMLVLLPLRSGTRWSCCRGRRTRPVRWRSSPSIASIRRVWVDMVAPLGVVVSNCLVMAAGHALEQRSLAPEIERSGLQLRFGVQRRGEESREPRIDQLPDPPARFLAHHLGLPGDAGELRGARDGGVEIAEFVDQSQFLRLAAE